MNPQEAAAVLTKAVAYTGQWTDDNAPRAWAEALATVRLEDALQAVANLGVRPIAYPKTVPPILPANIIDEVKRIRSKRVDGFDASMIDMPPSLTVRECQDRINRARELMADGRQLPQIEAARFTPERGSMREAIRGLIAAAHPKAVRDVA